MRGGGLRFQSVLVFQLQSTDIASAAAAAAVVVVADAMLVVIVVVVSNYRLNSNCFNPFVNTALALIYNQVGIKWKRSL